MPEGQDEKRGGGNVPRRGGKKNLLRSRKLRRAKAHENAPDNRNARVLRRRKRMTL